MALAVVAGLWLLVFVPSWFKRAQDRERGIVTPRKSSTRTKPNKGRERRPSVDNFAALAREYASELEEQAPVDERAWERTELPAPKTFQGTLEVVELAEVTSMDEVRSKVVARKLEQHELDEILRRRRANG